MECSSCGVRSAVGYCVACQAMLCEQCGTACDMCGKMTCSEHVYKTHSGKRICPSCVELRKREKRERMARGEEEAPFEGLAAAQQAQEIPAHEALATSARQPTQPWQWALYLACVAVAIVLVLLVFPSLRRAPLTPTTYVPTSIAPIVIALLAGVWAVVGLVNEAYYKDRSRCGIGLGIAALTILLAVAAIATDPARKIQQNALFEQEIRKDMTPKELSTWREDKLQKYDRGGEPAPAPKP